MIRVSACALVCPVCVSRLPPLSFFCYYRRTPAAVLCGPIGAKRSMDEVLKALEATQAGDTGDPTIFDKILAKQIPSTPVHEDDLCYAFRDINPQAPTHVLLIPKIRAGLTQIRHANPEQHCILLGHMMCVAAKIGREECRGGFRLVVNDGKNGAQSVYHLHIHILGGRQMMWPPG